MLALVFAALVVTPLEAAAVEYAREVSSRLNTTGRAIAMPVPFKDGTQDLGEITVRLEIDDTVLVSKSDIAERLHRILDGESRRKLAAIPDKGGFAGLPDFEAAGISLRFDAGLQELRLEVGADGRQTSDISISGATQHRASSALAEPALVSGYLNVIAGIDHLWSGGGEAGAFDGRTSGRIELQSAVRLRDTVFENTAIYEGAVDTNVCPPGAQCLYDHAGGLKRQTTRVVRDWPEQHLRLQAGDTEPIGGSLQRAVETLGLSLEKSARKLAPDDNKSVSARTTLRIERPSEVDVVVNGSVLQRLKLQPGTYNIRDLPLATGANEIKLAITDDSGATRTEAFTTYTSGTQLPAGESEWAVSLGAPSYLRDNERAYEGVGDFIGTGILRYGLSDRLTAESHLQGDDETVMGGGGVIAQTEWGVFGLMGAFSTGERGFGTAADVTWELLKYRGLFGERNESLTFSAEYRSPDFRRPGEALTRASGIIYPEYNYWARFSGTYSVALDWSVAATISGRYQLADDGAISASPFVAKGDRYGADLTLSRPLGPMASASVLLGYSNESFLRDLSEAQKPIDPSFRASFRIHLRPDEKTTLSTSYDTLDRYGTVSAYRADGDGIGRWDTSVDVQSLGHLDGTTASGSIGYYGNRAEVRASHHADIRGISASQFAPESELQRSSVRVGSSIAFADGHVAVGPPIRGGAYAIVYPHESIAGKEITIGGVVAPRAKADGWGAAVVTDLPAYSQASFGVDVDGLPVGYSLGAAAFDVRAGYKQGYALEVGSAYSVSVYGSLLHADGTPVALSSGTAYSERNPDRRVSLFTNAGGKFGIEGLAPGRWMIDIASEGEAARFVLEIPKGVEGLYKVGALQPTGVRQ